jgi:methyl-accepting chemotaxis protein
VTTDEMTRNVSDAAVGTGQMAANLAQVVDAAAATSRGTGDSEAAAEELARMSAEMRGLVGRFAH